MSPGDRFEFRAAQADGRLGFEAMLADLSSRFVNLPPAEVDREIEEALRRVCETLDLDFAALWQWSAGLNRTPSPTHAYPALGGPQAPDPGTRKQYPWTEAEMQAGRTVIFSSLEELPDEAAIDRESARRVGIKSNLTLPLAVGGEPPIGALAFNTLEAERAWPEPLVKRLRLVAQVFTNALARKRADEALLTSEARLAAGAHLAGLGFYEVDFATGVIYMDGQLRDLIGFPGGQGLRGLEFWFAHLHPDDYPRVVEKRDQLEAGRIDHLSVEYRYLHPARGEMWIQHLAGVRARDAAGRRLRTYGVLRDITDRKRAEEEMRGLSRRLIRAQEEERALLARELHDDVTQRLAVLAIDVGRAEGAAPDAAQARGLRALREAVVRLSEDIHTLAYQLHPSVLEELGLAEALRAECERRGRRSALEVTLDLHPVPDALQRDAALSLFRVAQEGLTNVARHAGARAVTVTLCEMDGGVCLAVHDDGVGFDPQRPGGTRHLGLASMHERMQLVNGTLEIESAPGRGTTVIAWVPLNDVSP